MQKKKYCKKRRVGLIVAILVIAIVLGCGIYVSDYYRALPEALAVLGQDKDGVTVTETKNEQVVFAPENPQAGLIFYPGGKVQYEAYAPLVQKLAESGILCVLVHMPANLAVLDMNAADGIREQFPEVEEWYIGGHSLGGSMAASYISDHVTEYEGLVLLAAYSTENLGDSGLKVVSVYGSEDGVMNMEKYAENRENLPDDFSETVIAGGNHAYFGAYGLQEGDGTASITSEEQIEAAAEAILGLIL